MTRADSVPGEAVEDAVLAMKQTDPELTAPELASRIGCPTERVGKLREEHDRIELEAEVLEPRDPSPRDDPARCPFCGDPIDAGGPGSVDHIEYKTECAVAFSRWRDGVSGDVAGEWVA